MKFTLGVRKIVQLEIVTALNKLNIEFKKRSVRCGGQIVFFNFGLHHITTVLLLKIIDRTSLAGVCFSARDQLRRDEVDYEACQLIHFGVINCNSNWGL